MKLKRKLTNILNELEAHIPFTLAGATLGIVFMLLFRNMEKSHAAVLFGVFHPAHVFLSALVTASIFAVHFKKKKFFAVLLIGYFGSIGVATLSDSVMPYIGAKVFGLDVPAHCDGHHVDTEESTHIHTEDCDHNNNETTHVHTENCNHGNETAHVHTEDCTHGHAELHIGFIEQWYMIHPVAILGVIVAWFIPRSKCPHATHVLISTWATSAHVLMNLHREMSVGVVTEMFLILFLAVWLPCCISDIIFPMLFVDSELAMQGTCACHSHSKAKQENTDE